MEKIKVALDWYPNNNHAGLFIADAEGYFEKAGINVEIEGSVNSFHRSEDADILIVTEPTLLMMKDRGRKITAVARIFQRCDSGIVSLKSAGITCPKDLEGKRLSSLDVSWFGPVMEFCVKAGGGDYDKVNVVRIDVGDITEHLGIDTDATWVYGAWELAILEAAGIEYNYFNIADIASVFDFAAPCICASEEMITKRPGSLKAFLSACSEGYKRIASDPSSAAAYAAPYIPKAGDIEIVKNGLVHMSDRLLNTKGEWGRINHLRWARFADFMCEKGLITERTDGEYTNSFLE